MTLAESLELIEKVFVDAPPRELKTIPIIGCCSQHADDFEWYRDHDWQDLRKIIRDSDGDLRKSFDPFQFGSLDIVAFHYFLPGVLTGLGDYVMAPTSGEDGFDVLFCMDWLSDVVPQLKEVRKSVIAQKVPAFNDKERWAIRNFLTAFASHIDEWGPHSNEITEIDKALERVWK